MDSFKIRLFSPLVLVILCVDFSSEQFGDWFDGRSNDTSDTIKYSSGTNSTVAQILSSTLSETQSFSSKSTALPFETSPTLAPTPSPTTYRTTPSTSSSSTPSNPLSSATIASTPLTSVQPIISSNSWTQSTEQTTKTSLEKPKECLNIGLNAKIIFKYNSKEGFEQQFEIIGGNSNGELIQPDKCLRDQTLIIKYDLVEKTKLILGVSFDDTDISINSMRFEYPFYRLPDDFDKDNHSEEVQTCSADQINSRDVMYDKCLIAENKDIKHYSLKYKINDQIYCKELPLIVLKNNKTSIDILFIDFRFVITDYQIESLIQRSDEYCPINGDNESDLDAMFAGTTKIWVGVSYAVVGALIMFGFAFIYEKFVREKLLYNPIDRQEPEV